MPSSWRTRRSSPTGPSRLVFGGQDARGLQPVVEVDPYEDIHALPIASNVDRLFDAYAHYLELIHERPDYNEDRGTWPVFPWGVPEIIAADQTLMGMLMDAASTS